MNPNTPRTNDEILHDGTGAIIEPQVVLASFAEQLEVELVTAGQQLDSANKAIKHAMCERREAGLKFEEIEAAWRARLDAATKTIIELEKQVASLSQSSMLRDDAQWIPGGHHIVEDLDGARFAENPSELAPAPCSAIPSDHPEAICDDCHGPNVVWFAPNHLWNKVVRRHEVTDPMLCPRCFILRAWAAGIDGSWVVTKAEAKVYD